MKNLFFLALLLFGFQNLYAHNEIVFEKNTWEQVIKKAKIENKLIFIDISLTDNSSVLKYKDQYVADIYNTNFINIKVNGNDADYEMLTSKYNIKNLPAYLYVNSEGTPIYFINNVLTGTDLVNGANIALKSRYETKPIGVWDMEYETKKEDKQFLFNYIEKRIVLGLDNTTIIDQYVGLLTKNELLNNNDVLLTLLNNGVFNVNGNLFRLIISHRDEIKNTCNVSDIQLNQIIKKSIDHSFSKACDYKNESLLESVINTHLTCSICETDNADVIRNEYFTKFYYKTKQPLLLSNYVTLYANTLINEGISIDKNENIDEDILSNNSSPINQKALFPSTFDANPGTNNQPQAEYSYKLREAAQYVVEMLSNKTMLNNALAWSQKAIDLSDDFRNYETHACILYKLGKRSEAIASMEKAHKVVLSANEKQTVQKQVEAKLIKMKRGERIY